MKRPATECVHDRLAQQSQAGRKQLGAQSEMAAVLVLGINDDQYDSGATLTDGHHVIFAANEERYSRQKNEGGFPYRTLEGLLRYTQVDPADIAHVCVSGIMTPPFPKRVLPRLHAWIQALKRGGPNSAGGRLLDFITFYTPIAHTSPDSWSRPLIKASLPMFVRRTLPKSMRKARLHFVEHHRGHAAAAWYLSGFPEGLALTADGMGDGLAITVSRCHAGRMERLWSATSKNSFGLFFEMITEALGFIPCRHEGKLNGLAAMGNADHVDVPPPFHWEADRLVYTGDYGRRGLAWARDSLVSRYNREDVSAWAQHQLETHLLQIARDWLARTGLRRLVVAGGTFANVKLNQKLHELDLVDELFVCPNMGDGGLSLGAVCAEGFLDLQKVADVFWGESFNAEQVEAALRQSGLASQKCAEIHEKIADALCRGRLVGRFDGRMEWGPRALGNRTILAPTTDRALVDRLNDLLKRNDFMPFAPAALHEDAPLYCKNVEKAIHAAEFMTACFRSTDEMKRNHPAVVHVDDTARIQLVRKDANPAFHRILQAYKGRTGHGILLNTSFNIHEEPIVHTPEEGIRTFLAAGLDCLAIGDYWVDKGSGER